MIPRTASAALLSLGLAAGPASAQDPDPGQGVSGIVHGVRIGVLAHDIGPLTVHDEDAVDFNVEVQFASPAFLDVILAPRPHVGATFNFDGDATDQLYAGLTWSFDLSEEIYLDLAAGGAVHNGKTTSGPSDRTLLGCRFLFRGGAELGWQVDDSNSVGLHFDHVSNAFLCEHNEGLETVGVRYGFQF